MSRQSAIIITFAAIVIGLLGVGAWYVFLSPRAQSGEGGGIRDVFSGFFPSGTNGGTGNTQPTTDNKQPETPKQPTTGNQPAPVVREVSHEPTAGFVLIDDKKEGAVVRFMERETGHTFSAPLAVVTEARLTNTTIPKVQEAIFSPSGTMLVARYLDEDNATIRSFAGKLNPKTSAVGVITEGDLQGKYLDNGIVDLVSAPAAEKIFYIVYRDGGASGIIANADGTKPATVFSSLIREWLPQWVGDTVVYLTTKASGSTAGHLFSLNTSSGALTKVVGDIFGLTTNVNSKNTLALYSSSSGSGFELFTLDLKTKSASELPIATLAEKCAWDSTAADIVYCGVPNNPASALYPDSWYKGIVSFEDSLWRINVATGEVTVVTTFSDTTQTQIDIVNPRISKKGDYVVFMNKNDLSLWSVKIK